VIHALQTLGYAFLGGLLPSLLWLYFLLKEDGRCPEPKTMVALAFAAGMATVPLVLPFEIAAQAKYGTGSLTIFAWAAAEETLKYVMAALFILWRRSVDESPDYVIYMVTVALGFAAAENMLFLFAPLSAGAVLGTGGAVVTENLRFIGSSVLHATASALVGFSLAMSYTRTPYLRLMAVATGLILAIGLHTAFNTIIIHKDGTIALGAFFLVWMVAVVFFAVFEILKYIQYRNLPKNTC